MRPENVASLVVHSTRRKIKQIHYLVGWNATSLVFISPEVKESYSRNDWSPSSP